MRAYTLLCTIYIYYGYQHSSMRFQCSIIIAYVLVHYITDEKVSNNCILTVIYACIYFGFSSYNLFCCKEKGAVERMRKREQHGVESDVASRLLHFEIPFRTIIMFRSECDTEICYFSYIRILKLTIKKYYILCI